MNRIVLVPSAGEENERGARQIIIDLLIDRDGAAVGPFPAFGRVGDYTRPETLFPFALMGNGALAFGAHASVPGSADILAIRSARVIVGAEILRTTNDRAESFVVAEVTPLMTA